MINNKLAISDSSAANRDAGFWRHRVEIIGFSGEPYTGRCALCDWRYYSIDGISLQAYLRARIRYEVKAGLTAQSLLSACLSKLSMAYAEWL